MENLSQDTADDVIATNISFHSDKAFELVCFYNRKGHKKFWLKMSSNFVNALILKERRMP